MAPHKKVKSSRTPMSRTEVKAPQTHNSPVSIWIHSMRVAYYKKSVFSGLSRSLFERIHLAIRSSPTPFGAATVAKQQRRTELIKQSGPHNCEVVLRTAMSAGLTASFPSSCGTGRLDGNS